jgi:hypothetical protein
MPELPSDLERLGQALTDAAAQVVAVRRHRAELRLRLVACVAAGVLVFAAMTPSHLGSADQPAFLQFAAAPAEAAVNCDQPRGSGGDHFVLPASCQDNPQPQAAR